MKIALLCPTCERIDHIKRLIDSIENTVSDQNNITLHLGIDVDDPTHETVYDMAKTKSYINIIDIQNDHKFLGLGKIWNLMAAQAKEEIFAMIGDDMVFETKDWDKKIIDEFAINPLPTIKLVHCNDGMRGPGNVYSNVRPLAVNSFIHRTYYDVLGYYTREEWKHGFHDTWLQDVFTKLDRITYRHDIVIKHLHHSLNGSTDKVSEVLESNWETDSNNKTEYYNSLESIRRQEVEILKQEFGPKLSILICSLNRRKDFLERLKYQLKPQVNKDVEVLVNIDDGNKTIGQKRQELLNAASGKYIAYIDDDDTISSDYVSLILKAIKTNPDVVGIHLIMNVDGTLAGKTYHSLEFDHWFDEGIEGQNWRYYYRNPNHLNPIRRTIACEVGFENISNGEDRIYSYKILPLLKTQICIEPPIYFYEVRTNKNV